MAKYVINQSTKNGKIITNVGDHQQVVIHQHQTVSSDEIPEAPEVPPIPGTPGQNTYRAIGRGAKVFVNGKRVQ